MKGQILDYSVQTNSGTITGVDGGRYYFSGSEWKAGQAPVRGTVTFTRHESTPVPEPPMPCSTGSHGAAAVWGAAGKFVPSPAARV